METINPTKYAEKLLRIICDMFCLNYPNISQADPKITLTQLNITGADKTRLFKRLAIKFNTHLTQAHIDKAQTLWDCLKFAEGHNDFWDIRGPELT